MDNNEEIDPFAYHDGFEKYRDVKSHLIFDGGMEEKPQVSIMIPTFRRPDLLRAALESAITQKTDIPFEVVVVDNESSPDVSRVVDSIIKSSKARNIRLYRNEKNIGMFGNWNRCIELAASEWVSLLSDDDVLESNFIQISMSHKASNQFMAFNVGHFGKLMPRSNRVGRIKSLARSLRDKVMYRNGQRQIRLADALIGNPVTGVLGVLFNKEAALKIGGFDDSYWPSADYLFFTKYWLYYGGVIKSIRIAKYRWDANESFNIEAVIEFIKVNCKIREGLLSHFNDDSLGILIYKLSLSFQKRLQANLYIEKFNQEECRDKILNACQLPKRPLPFPQAISWLLLYIFYIVRPSKNSRAGLAFKK